MGADNAAPQGTPEGHRRHRPSLTSDLKAGFGRTLARLGAGPMGRPLVRVLASLGRRGLIPTAIANAAVRRATSLGNHPTIDIVRTVGGSRTHLHLDLTYSGCVDLLVSPSPGAPDHNTAALLIGLAREAELFVDVGANVGLYTYLVAAGVPKIRIISFEPTPDLAAIVAENVGRNRWHSRVDVRAEAIGGSRGATVLYALEGADTENTLDASRLAGRKYRTISVPVVPLDDILSEKGLPDSRTVLKIDVEGHERSALDGLERTLRSPGRRPDVIMEFLGQAINDERIVERVLGLRMDVYYIGPGGLTPLRASSDLASVHTLGYWNFLLTSRTSSDIAALAARVGTRVTSR
jgi:FkbM family methyltransferase